MPIEQQARQYRITVFHNIAFMVAAFYLHGFIYEYFIFPFWEYRLFRFEPDQERALEALASVVIFSLIMPKSIEKVSDLYMIFLSFLFVSANAALYTKAGLAKEVFIATFLSSMAIGFLRNIGFLNIPKFHLSIELLLSMVLIFCSIAVLRVVLLQGFEFISIDFLDVGERRFAARESITGLDAYLTTYGQQLAVMGFVGSLFFKKIYLSLIYLVLVAVFFIFIGQKSFIFIAIFSFILVKLFGRRINIILLAALILMSIFIVIDQESSIGFYLGSLIFRRISYAPSILNEAYMSYYLENGFIYWGYSKIGLGLVPYTDDLSPAFRIGEVLFPGTQAHANTGIIGSGYMNAGFAGIALYATALALICAFLDRLGKQSGNTMLITALCVPQLFLATTTSDLPGMILSGGLGTAILFSWLLPDSTGSASARLDGSEARSP